MGVRHFATWSCFHGDCKTQRERAGREGGRGGGGGPEAGKAMRDRWEMVTKRGIGRERKGENARAREM